MLRIAAFVVLLLSPMAWTSAQTTLPAVEVVGVQIGSATICSSGCSNWFPAALAELPGQVTEISHMAAPRFLMVICDGDVQDRETAVWNGYRSYLEDTYGNDFAGQLRQAYVDAQNLGQTLTVYFTDDSSGTYLRTGAGLDDEIGFSERSAPRCAP